MGLLFPQTVEHPRENSYYSTDRNRNISISLYRAICIMKEAGGKNFKMWGKEYHRSSL
jgi:hypothetical protein